MTVVSGDPVAGGLARSLAKPGGNLTGVSYYATELSAKRLELLKEAIPGIVTVDVLANPASPTCRLRRTRSGRAESLASR